MHNRPRLAPLASLGGLAILLWLTPGTPLRAAGETFLIKVVDSQSGQPIPFRMHLKNQRGRPVKPPQVPYWGDHFTADGEIALKVPVGNYTFEIECGPEYLFRSGYFTIMQSSRDQKTVDMKRFTNLAEQGWYAGDLHVQRRESEMPLCMAAEHLHVAPLITWTTAKNEWADKQPPAEHLKKLAADRYLDLLGGKDERGENALSYFGLDAPLAITGVKGDVPPMLEFLQAANANGKAWVDVDKPTWWDLPIWLALGRVQSIGIAHRDMGREAMLSKPKGGGRPRSLNRYAGARGEGLWTQDIYYHVLNCGFQIPPSAGSGSGLVDNPLGYNRVYVKVEDEFTYAKWWDGLRAGRCFVTNGPLIVANVDGQWPGHTFTEGLGNTLDLQAALTMHTRDKIAYLEVIRDGEVKHAVRLQDWVAQNGELPALTFKESGWFLIRAVAENDQTFRFACTAPYYVRIGDKRISKRSVQFFLDWLKDCEGRTFSTPAAGDAYRAQCAESRKFWDDLLKRANAE